MKKFLLASVALFGLAGAAAAADLPVRAAPPAPIVVPIFTWTGFYVGVNAGGAWSNNNNHDVFVPGVGFVNTGGGNNGGFTGGGQIGYNYQVGGWVIGLETDIQFADLGGNNRDNDFLFVNNPNFFGLRNNNNGNNFFGTVRARAGYAFDRTLLYVTGGFAYGDTGGGNDFFGNNNNTNAGWTVGGGVEYAFTNNLTARLEGLFVSLERNRNNDFLFLNTVNTFGFENRKNNEFGVVRAGLNYKFNTY
ncbi:outer membrane protein [Microvirga terricola]|uniref:Porin family protein n=1 Tax=Microvirga terricola TaxID=2719797 RepID=A0ABX0V9B5_9HYPH|nr:outer membrane beta-barrel protein [Microvirga terricola]NIX76267.1 porin family protein [Microvirga terricola]